MSTEKTTPIGDKKSEHQSREHELKLSLDFDKTPIDKIAVWVADILGAMAFLIGCMLKKEFPRDNAV